METKDDSLKSQIAIRCAKAAVLLSSLKTSQNCNLRATIDHGNEVKIAFSTSLEFCQSVICVVILDFAQEREIMKRAITDLKIELAKERRKAKRIKLCGFVGLVMVLLSLWSFCLILATKY